MVAQDIETVAPSGRRTLPGYLYIYRYNIYSCIKLLLGVAFVVVLNLRDRHYPLPGLRNTKRMSIPPEREPYQGYE